MKTKYTFNRHGTVQKFDYPENGKDLLALSKLDGRSMREIKNTMELLAYRRGIYDTAEEAKRHASPSYSSLINTGVDSDGNVFAYCQP